MPKNVVGLFESPNVTSTVVRDLQTAGITRESISAICTGQGGTAAGQGTTPGGAAVGGSGSMIGGMPASVSQVGGLGSCQSSGPLSRQIGSGGQILTALKGMGIPDDDAHLYAEGVRRGNTLITAHCEDNVAEKAAEIMRRHGAIDIHNRANTWRQQGWSRFDESGSAFTAKDMDAERAQWATAASHTQGEVALPVVEEELQLGKREVERGGVRVFQHVTEKPVHEDVTLREERVTVERRPVDRPVAGDRVDAFKERTFEVRETAEEAVVSKQARVKEEVVVRKDAVEHTERIDETIRRTDVEVEKVGTTGKKKI